MKEIYASKRNIQNDGQQLVTKELQELIDEAYKTHSVLYIDKGTYLTGPLFLHNNMVLILEDSTLLATTDEKEYKDIFTRVAGIEMNWYPAILNCIDLKNVNISGNGAICGAGPYWWNKFWGEDKKSQMFKEYSDKRLRWACDYDCKRPRNLLIQNCKNVKVSDITSIDSGFWNVHILYSKKIEIDGIKIKSDALNSPSTDGIDIDSSTDITIKNCVISCHDDSIVIKSGRGVDGLRVNKPTRTVLIKDCILEKGFGVTIGSEVSGGIYDITIIGIIFKGTTCGLRIKSSEDRRGYIKDVYANNLSMENVDYLFLYNLNWNPTYCTCSIPADYDGEIKPYYKLLCEQPSDKYPLTVVSNVTVSNVKSGYTTDYTGPNRCFLIKGFENQPIKNIAFTKMNICCIEEGTIEYANNVMIDNCDIRYARKHGADNKDFDNI